MNLLERARARHEIVSERIDLAVEERRDLTTFIRVYQRLAAEEEGETGSASSPSKTERILAFVDEVVQSDAKPTVNIPAVKAELERLAPDTYSPEGASEEVGGFPVAAAPQPSGATGDQDQADTKVNAEEVPDPKAGDTSSAPIHETATVESVPADQHAAENADPSPAEEDVPTTPSSSAPHEPGNQFAGGNGTWVAAETAVPTLPPSEEGPKPSSEPVPVEPEDQGAEDAAEAHEAGAALAADAGGEDVAASEEGVATPSAADEIVTLKRRVQDLHAAKPHLTCKEAALELGANPGTVSAYSTALQIHWNREGKPKPPPDKILNHAVYRLKNAKGEYLHYSGQRVTTELRTAWKGTGFQVVAQKNLLPLARVMKEERVDG